MSDAACGHDKRFGGVFNLPEKAKGCLACMVECQANEIESLRSQNAGWLAANGPGGWIDDLRSRLAELEAAQTGTIHESWQHRTHAELLDGLQFQGAMTKALLEANTELESQLAEVNAAFEAEQTEKWKMAGKLAEATALLRDIYSYAEDQGMETLMDMLDAFPAKLEAKP